MHVISVKKLRQFWQAPNNAEAEGPLRAWYRTVRHATWDRFADVRATYGTADQVKKSRKVVFDVGGNKFRLIAVIDYQRHKVFVRAVMDHAEYDRGLWKKDTFGEDWEKPAAGKGRRRTGGRRPKRK